jgi:hypothetical protein
MALKKVNSVSDLVKHLKADASKEDGPLWYRGHSVATKKNGASGNSVT